ncbi:hypothetical protein QWJ34_12430 [Saccharibacillus sp. CPCC 101409]|uniref:hypothetical protein n=1 Tax=Saccharibacillus sp. CPCC 101409 TaxID=3058041 RepID=UPI002671E08B|nr:hypothetical protein [Saccharibacillus sp. CPCC 101409]MDO3410570.1 hypothetical protein [Saccharibacillus sp. CPCC 101409]
MTRIKLGSLLLCLILVLAGCGQPSSLLTEVKEKNLNKDILSFIEQTDADSGLYLFSRAGETSYIICNNKHVVQGEQAVYIESVDGVVKNRELEVRIEEGYTEDYDDERLGKLRVFKINDGADFDSIRMLKNQKDTPFDVVGG